MKDLCVLDVEGVVNAYKRQYDKERTIIVFSHLLRFTYSKGMLTMNPFDEEDNLIVNTILRESNLTELGKLYFDKLTDKWLGYTDNNDGKVDRINNTQMLDKYYDKLVKDHESKSK